MAIIEKDLERVCNGQVVESGILPYLTILKKDDPELGEIEYILAILTKQTSIKHQVELTTTLWHSSLRKRVIIGFRDWSEENIANVINRYINTTQENPETHNEHKIVSLIDLQARRNGHDSDEVVLLEHYEKLLGTNLPS